MHSWIDVVAFYMAAATSDPINLGIFAQYGLLGIITAGLIVFARTSYKRETDRSDRLEAEVVRLNALIITRNDMIVERVIPGLAAAAQAADAATMMLRDIQREREMTVIRGATGHPRRARPGEDRP